MNIQSADALKQSLYTVSSKDATIKGTEAAPPIDTPGPPTATA